jgi:hypothetical protein
MSLHPAQLKDPTVSLHLEHLEETLALAIMGKNEMK